MNSTTAFQTWRGDHEDVLEQPQHYHAAGAAQPPPQQQQQPQQQQRQQQRRRSTASAEPSIASPLTCIAVGDSLLFDISAGCYPVYQKDSLLNTDADFDYGAFRDVAARAAALSPDGSAQYTAFAFTFTTTGVHAFASSCGDGAVTVVTVMPADMACTTAAAFVPLTTAALVGLGVAKQDGGLTLTPDWPLIGGLLGGLAAAALAVVAALYYFRSRAWTTGIEAF
ncbi:hypothetical protein JKP88DRAFT_172331 [Tribonema minus]|uniref:Uncharacterized protein n=1 Tax=Tribonema minus TaxID=303371 RepID=A0A835YHV5_9STRA|nr:hypothetical protein JKP88DRAFT_172331 [Tribonema minus]